MKRLTIIFAAIMMLMLPVMAFAAAEEVSGTTAIGDGTHANGGPDLTFTPSPNVTLSVYITTTAYAMTSAHTLTDTANGIEYGTTNTATGYAQRPKTTAAASGPATVTAATTLPGSDWAWMGGSS